MADTTRPKTPPRPAPAKAMDITPEQVRRMEESRLRAKALRNQQTATSSQSPNQPRDRYPVASTAGQKRPHAALTSTTTSSLNSTNVRDARNALSPSKPNSNNGLSSSTDIQAARKFTKFAEYDFSKMIDTKGGFLSAEDDPHNKHLHAADPNDSTKPSGMTLQEWERTQLQRRLRDARAGPYEPTLSILSGESPTSTTLKKCRECSSLEIDFQWHENFHLCVCHTCKDKLPEKYSLLTKTEAKEDYLLTDPELKDERILPHLEKPNPHKATWNNMMLYLRCQVEEYAFGKEKWGSAEALDQEFAKRQKEVRERKERKFKSKLDELKKRTRVEAYKRARGGGGGEFGDTIGKGRHEHEWGRSVEDPVTGMMKKTCGECGMEVEELEF